MKYMIKIDTDGISTIMGYPSGSIADQNRLFHRTIDCDTYETVETCEVLTTGKKGRNAILLVDGDSVLNSKEDNPLASVLSDTDVYGDVLLVGVDGEELCGIDELMALNLVSMISVCRRIIYGEEV